MVWGLGLMGGFALGAEPVSESASSGSGDVTGTTSTVLREIVVVGKRPAARAETEYGGDAAQKLRGWEGVELQQNGASSLPVIHGLADERVRVLVDGMTLVSPCPNHMNPPLAYVNPSQVEAIRVWTGLTPVSEGGDSLGGTIRVNSAPPTFAEGESPLYTATTLSSYFGTNADSYGGSVYSAVAGPDVSVAYSGAYSQASDYKDGHGNTVTSTFYETWNQSVTLAARQDGHLGEITAGLTSTPNEGFVSQWMDMVRNSGEFVNAHYQGNYDWGQLDSRAFWQQVVHGMNISDDKLTFPSPMWMPMDTHAINTGYTIKAEILVEDIHTLRVGNEFHRMELDDTWPEVPGTMMMAPNTFVNINNGERNRLAFFAEWETRYNREWTSLFGVRNDTVWMNTGNVQGYNAMYAADANAFNSRSHAKTDVNLDLTAMGRYEPESWSTYEFGYARKSRSPNLYERYAWSTVPMAAEMINWYGDGNYYTGNLELKPEVAHTVSFNADFHDADRKDWEVSATPYYTYVDDYIDVDRFGTRASGPNTLSRFYFANHDAQLYGVDFKWKKQLWSSDEFGRGQLRGTGGWVRGERTDGNNLYHMMPLHTTITLEENFERWTGAVETVLVTSKTEVDGLRNEPQTAGYALLNFRMAYQWPHVRLNAGINNVLDKFYYDPLGGINFDQFLASNKTTVLQPVASPGRVIYTSITISF